MVVHSTDSQYGNVATVDRWHKDRGWEGVGYHYVILNCYPVPNRWDFKRPDLASDGVIEIGRPESLRGAHARGYNHQSLSIAMVGKSGALTSKQIESAVALTLDIKKRYPIERVVGHYELTDLKTDPDIDMDLFRELVAKAEGA